MRKNSLRDYFSFSRGEQCAIFILLAVILILNILPHFLSWTKRSAPDDFKIFEAAMAGLEEAKDSSAPIANANRKKKDIPAFSPDSLFPFDPNMISVQDWQKLGLSARTAEVIRHYLSAGGKFYRKEDLKKIYGFPASAYQRLAPYVHIRKEDALDAHNVDSVGVSSSLGKEGTGKYSGDRVIDINAADSAAWEHLRGIGPVLSARIVRFREKLGGFYSISQLAEVYGLPDSVFQRLKQQLKISKVALKKININTATVDELKSHPYIGSRLAASIKAFRDQHGPFRSPDDLKQIALVDDQIYRKLAPYLETGE